MDLDTRTVLMHLNAMGFRNISAEQLKNFTKDLKKIVKYDTRLLNKDINSKQDNNHFRAPTLASSAKTQKKFERKAVEENQENEEQPRQRHTSAKTSDTCNKMWIRPRLEQKKSHNEDAVQLYQKYKKDWDRFKQRFPGENDHSDLRWQIRSNMLGDC